MNNIRPRLSMMTAEQIQQTHQYTLRILGETGVRVDSPSVLALLERKLGLKADGRTLRFQRKSWKKPLTPHPKPSMSSIASARKPYAGRRSSALWRGRHGPVLPGTGQRSS